jgi:hypothetical protein
MDKNFKKIIKKSIKILVIFLVLIGICVAAIFVYKKINNILISKENEANLKISQIEEEQKTAIENLQNELTKEKELNSKIYDNPILVGLYTKSTNGKKLTPNYSSNWDKDNIMGMFYTVYTNKSTINGNSFSSVWTDYYNNYLNIDKYKIGYNIKYTLRSGEVIDKQILKPDDTTSLFVNLQFYLYDDVTPMPGRRYYHMTQPEVTDKTIYTSVKIVAYKETVDVVSPIELTTFTYDGEEDFDTSTGKYIGKSLYKTIINRK